MPDDLRPVRPAPPTKPTLTRPDVELPDRPQFEGSLTVGSDPRMPTSRHVLSPDERAVLMAVGRNTMHGQGAPGALVKRMTNAGLLDLSVTDVGWSLSATPVGLEANQRGWFSLD